MNYIALTDFEFNELKASKGDNLVLDEVLSARLLRAGYIAIIKEKREVTTPPAPVFKPIKKAVKKQKR